MGSGLRLYLTVLLASVFECLGLIHLPDTLSALSLPWVIGVAGVLTLTEFLADKIPAFDSLWDAIHTSIRIPAGAVLAARAVTPPALLTFAALGAQAVGYLLATRVFEFYLSFNPWLLPAGIAAGVACAGVGGWLSLRHVLARPALQSLRDA